MAKSDAEEVARLERVVVELQAQAVRCWNFLTGLQKLVGPQEQRMISRFMQGDNLGRNLLAKENLVETK